MRPGGWAFLPDDTYRCKRCRHTVRGRDAFTGGYLAGHILACIVHHCPPRSAFEALEMVFTGLKDALVAEGIGPEHALGYAAAWLNWPEPVAPMPMVRWQEPRITVGVSTETLPELQPVVPPRRGPTIH